MKSRIIVPDASVILKWAFNSMPEEEDTEKADALLQSWIEGKFNILLPGLWTFEIANVLGLKVPELADACMEVFIDYRFTSMEVSHVLCKQAFSIMRKYSVTFYDAIYHAIAITHKGLLVTADERYFKKVKTLGNIILLEDFSL